jgi:hypothetical protein
MEVEMTLEIINDTELMHVSGTGVFATLGALAAKYVKFCESMGTEPFCYDLV